ncbi:MAG: RNA polymerase sigma factor RpoD/SigA [Treponema sp.]|jgi:RNA polymerase primary sigma factor|nr:RNA polymerase sigma factor RpoD/SigA [Treponema sp.]
MKNIKTGKKTASGKNFSQEDSVLTLYMREIAKNPLLSREEEENLARLAAGGDAAAREKLVKANLRFVISIAQKYRGQGLPLEDLISEGNVGLLTAASRFDVEKGYRFITYAVWWIRQSINKAICDKGRMIRLPVSKKGELAQIGKAKEAVPAETPVAEDDEIERIPMLLKAPVEKAGILSQLKSDVLSLDDPVQAKYDNSLTRKDIIADECNKSPIEAMENDELKRELDEIIDSLGKRSAEIIRCRYGLGTSGYKTLQELGERFNLSRERVRQLELRALGKIQQSPKFAMLKAYIA